MLRVTFELADEPVATGIDIQEDRGEIRYLIDPELNKEQLLAASLGYHFVL